MIRMELAMSRLAAVLFVTLGATFGAALPVAAQFENEELDALELSVADLAGNFPAFASFPWTESNSERAYLYGDAKGVVHLKVSDGTRTREAWRSFPLEGTIRYVLAADLDRDGKSEIVAATSGPRIYVWDSKEYDLLWESVDEKFESLQAIAIEDVDRDESLEIVLVVDNKVSYYDGTEFFREKEGRDVVDPTEILIGDVDGDLSREIITNDGYVIDTETLNIEWATDGFGYPISLFDVDSDGVPELLGEIDGAITIWDIKERREVW